MPAGSAGASRNSLSRSGRAIGAKGLTGTGYNGHTFWDIEGFVIPVLAYTAPEAAAHALRWRASTLEWLPSEDYATRSIAQVDSADPLWDRPALAEEVQTGPHHP